MRPNLIILAALLAITLPTVANAGPLVPVIIGALHLTGIVAAAATVVLDVAFAVATSALINVIAGKPSQGQERQASTTTLAIGETPRTVLFGVAAVGGTLG